MFLPNPGIMAAGVETAPPGQRLFTSTTTFVVPEGVYSTCAVAIAPGAYAYFVGEPEIGTPMYGGNGGGLVYYNNISVIPGEVLSIGFNSQVAMLTRANGSPIILLASNTAEYEQIGQVAFKGGAGSPSAIGESPVSGGGAAGYEAAGGAGRPFQRVGGGGTSPLGGTGGGNNGGGTPLKPSGVNGEAYGGGGSSSANFQNGVPGPGCVRIIWGEGRAFPNTNTGDM